MEGGWKKMLFFGTVVILVEATHQTGSSYTVEHVLISDLKMSWVEAQSYCRTHYDDLATISDEDDNSAANSMNHDGSFWIGLYDDVNSWKWSLDKSEVSDYRPWQDGQPDNKGGVENCVSMTDDGFWKDNICTGVTMPSICFSDAAVGSSAYGLKTQKVSWVPAQKSCSLQYKDLVSVRSERENLEIQNFLHKQGVKEAWIGMHRDSWKWSNGSTASFRRWRKIDLSNTNNSQPCAAMQQGYWDGWPCNTKLNFLCQNFTEVTETEPATISPAVQRRMTVKMKLMTNSDLEDPTISRQILQQLEAALNLKGVADVKLVWRTLTRDARGQTIK